MRVQQTLNSLDVLLILEPRKHLEVVQRLRQVPIQKHVISNLYPFLDVSKIAINEGKQRKEEHLLRLIVLLPTPPLVLQHLVDNQSSFRQRQRMRVLVRSQLQLRRGFQLALRNDTLAVRGRG